MNANFNIKRHLVLTLVMVLLHTMTFDLKGGMLDTDMPDSSGIVSDDFSASELNTQLWTFVDPIGDASYALTQSHLKISLPEGTDHDVWDDGNRSARLMQPTADIDFEIEAQFDVTVSRDYAAQGILIEGDADNFLRFDFSITHSTVRIVAATFVDGMRKTRLMQPIWFAELIYLRVQRVGDEWIQSYSYDHQEWHQAVQFTHSVAVTSVGLFAANGGVFPAFTASVDYFFNTASPIIPEDGVETVPASPSHLRGSILSMSEILLQWNDNSNNEDNFEIQRSSDGVTYTSLARTTFNTHFIDKIASTGGQYHYRVAATNSLGSSEFSEPISIELPTGPVVTFFYGDEQKFGHLGVPQRFINILGSISDSDVISQVFYSLNAGLEMPLKIGSDRMRLAHPGDFNIEIETEQLNLGHNTVTVRVVTNENAESEKSVNVFWHENTNIPPIYTIHWDTVQSIQNVAQVVDGKWRITNGVLRTVEIGFDRLVAMGDTTWANYQITVPITIHHFNYDVGEGSGPGVGLLARWKGHTGNDAPRLGHPYGILAWYRDHPPNPDDYKLLLYKNGDAAVAEDPSEGRLELNTPYMFKLSVQTATTDLANYKFKVWAQRDNEPAEWTLQATVSGPSEGSVLLVAHKADVSFGDVEITGIQQTAVSHTEKLTEMVLPSNFYPNPFNSTTTISFVLQEPQSVRLRVYNVLGELVDTSIDQQLLAGQHKLSWDGKDNYERTLPSGTYYYALQVGSELFNGRMLLIR